MKYVINITKSPSASELITLNIESIFGIQYKKLLYQILQINLQIDHKFVSLALKESFSLGFEIG